MAELRSCTCKTFPTRMLTFESPSTECVFANSMAKKRTIFENRSQAAIEHCIKDFLSACSRESGFHSRFSS